MSKYPPIDEMTMPEIHALLQRIETLVATQLPPYTHYIVMLEGGDAITHFITDNKSRTDTVAWLRVMADRLEANDDVGHSPFDDDTGTSDD